MRDVIEVLNIFYEGCSKDKIREITGLEGKDLNVILDRGVQSGAVSFNNKLYMLTPEGRSSLKKSLPYDGKLELSSLIQGNSVGQK